MTAQATYRRAVLGDLKQIAEMERDYFGRHAFGAAMLLYLLVNAGEGFRVAEDNGRVLGYVVVRRESVRRSRAEVPTFAVREDLRGRGVGSALLGEALELADTAGVRQVDLQVSAANTGAQRLYQRFGFHVVRTLPGYYGRGENAVLMRRRAPASDRATW